MRTYQIWIEGYQATGGHAGASYVGEAEGNNLNEAVFNLYKQRNITRRLDKHEDGHYTHWACRFYSSEHEARKSFG